jgi:hypothetical protein
MDARLDRHLTRAAACWNTPRTLSRRPTRIRRSADSDDGARQPAEWR